MNNLSLIKRSFADIAEKLLACKKIFNGHWQNDVFLITFIK